MKKFPNERRVYESVDLFQNLMGKLSRPVMG